jgi:peptidyl-prolyl cis-trans isomerase SurA
MSFRSSSSVAHWSGLSLQAVFAAGCTGAFLCGLSLNAAAQTAPPQAAQAAPATKPKTRTAAVTSPETRSSAAGSAIVMLVNDEPVTAYEVEQRARLSALSSNIGAKAQENFQRMVKDEATSAKLKAILEETIKQNQGKTREQIIAIFEQRKQQFALGMQKQAMDSARAGVIPQFRKDALEEIIEEKLKLQEAKKLGIEVSDDGAKATIKSIADRNKQTPEQFAQNLKGMGVDIETMKARFTSNFAWRDVIRRKFSAQISINQREVDKVVAATADGAEDLVELQVQKWTLPLPGTMDQGGMTKRLADADALRRKFAGCKSSGQSLIKDIEGAKFEAAKYVKPSSIAEPTRSMLLAAKDGEMVPPQISAGGVDVYALCGRQAGKADEKKREAAAQEVQAREFEMLAKRYMRDLRQDAHIERRS